MLVIVIKLTCFLVVVVHLDKMASKTHPLCGIVVSHVPNRNQGVALYLSPPLSPSLSPPLSLSLSLSLLSLRRETLVEAGHVTTQKVGGGGKKTCWEGGAAEC